MEDPKDFTLLLNQDASITSVITSVKEHLKHQYNIPDCESVQLIYRGFFLSPEKRFDDYNVHPDHVILAIVR